VAAVKKILHDHRCQGRTLEGPGLKFWGERSEPDTRRAAMPGAILNEKTDANGTRYLIRSVT